MWDEVEEEEEEEERERGIRDWRAGISGALQVGGTGKLPSEERNSFCMSMRTRALVEEIGGCEVVASLLFGISTVQEARLVDMVSRSMRLGFVIRVLGGGFLRGQERRCY